jgi:hypothetical protein
MTDAPKTHVIGPASWLAAVCVLAVTSASVLAIPAFPGAEGYGATTAGGRGGVVYEVTNLDDSGTGSLRAAVEASGPRTVVFRVSGTILLSKKLSIRNPYITIAGQTAPGDGICLRKYPLSIDANEVIIRYIRVRFGNESGTADDAVSSRFIKNLILDHVSSSWSVDESMSVYHCQNVTIQWCMVTESLYAAGHPSGNHGFGGIWGSNNSTQHHNLIAHHTSRNPRFASGSGNTDYRNNVIYNWGYNSCYGGENQQVDNGVPNPLYAFSNINMVANYYKPGPATQSDVSHRIANPSYRDVKTDYGKWYIAENVMVGSSAVTADNWNGGVDPQGGSGDMSLVKATTPFPVATTYPLTQQTATVAYSYVLNSAGCSLVRDSVDTRIVTEVANGTATYGGTYGANSGIIDSEATVGGWPTLNSTTAPADSDHDGMPDAWETANALNPNDTADRNSDMDGDGYTNLEEYLNSLCPDPYGADTTAPSPDPMNWATVPSAVSASSITMVAQTAADRSGVEYYFHCAAGGGHDSGWQESTTYTDAGLTQGITYSYQVKARDKSANQNETDFSSIASASAGDILVTGVSVSPTTASVGVGINSRQLTATVSPANATNKNVSWSSGNPLVATVSPSGLVTGVTSGSTIVTVTTNDGGFTATCAVTVSSLPTPLVKLEFNENTGSTVANTGSASATFTKTNPPAWSTNVPANGGASSVDFGTTNGNYYVESGAVVGQLANMQSFTVTGWVNNRNSTIGPGGNRIVSWIYNGANGVDIVYASGGALKVGINQWPDSSSAISSTGKIPTDAAAPASNWRFFAVTYRSSTSTIEFYFGDNSTPASLDKSLTYNRGAVGATIGKLAIGHFNTESLRTSRTDRMFRGLIDQIEVYGSALSSQEIQLVQNGQIADNAAPTPNPMTWATEPNPTGMDTITMTATTASDVSGVEYFFANVTDPGHNSAWQDSTTYTDTGLVNNTQYTYTVISRDKSSNRNETSWSGEASATTLRYDCTSPIDYDLDRNCQVDFLDLALIGDTWAGNAAAWTDLMQFATDWLGCNRNPSYECWQ